MQLPRFGLTTFSAPNTEAYRARLIAAAGQDRSGTVSVLPVTGDRFNLTVTTNDVVQEWIVAAKIQHALGLDPAITITSTTSSIAEHFARHRRHRRSWHRSHHRP